jgi:hypothetical protein
MHSIEKSALKRRQIVAGGEPRGGAAPGKEDAGMSPGRGDRAVGLFDYLQVWLRPIGRAVPSALRLCFSIPRHHIAGGFFP